MHDHEQLFFPHLAQKYREQRSFPMTEEEYLSHLDEVVGVLRAWGAVDHVKRAIASTREKPRVGKAVSIMIDLPSTLADEWVVK